MKFRTTIKITTEAKDKNEAMEIAGEYLSGNLMSGVDMKLSTASMNYLKKRAALAILAIIAFGVITAHFACSRPSSSFISCIPGDSVMQPPLKTSAPDNKYSDFNKEWQAKHAKEVLNSIK